MRFHRKIEEKTRQERLRNSTFRENLKVRQPILEAIEERQMRWFGHINRMADEKIVKGQPRRTENIKAAVEKRGGSWEEVKLKRLMQVCITC
jgi:hypothetical protein